MSTRSWLRLGMLALIPLGLASLGWSDQPAKPQPPEEPERLELEPNAGEIVKLRERLGPGLFRGTLFEQAGEAAPPNLEPASGDDRAVFLEGLRRAQQEAVQTSAEASASLPSAEGGDDLSPAVRLRRWAARLEGIAQQLEAGQAYDQADALRATAQEIWLAARTADRAPAPSR